MGSRSKQTPRKRVIRPSNASLFAAPRVQLVRATSRPVMIERQRFFASSVDLKTGLIVCLIHASFAEAKRKHR
ncbi:hypothetical protein BOSEA31B_13125 [Hyphomicrobiales bacterium]|nr:hypothetical protein BOSEA31B_13125 [Hyphomicrobiales bacterium]CAH1698899.1 hypothetical protein BOSEA1005_11952 [Hyphomicrobiales bacterium]CAI0342544.1 hypothetical protein BO1005MUT1_190057 [Hyphomicrobiales bacterium]